MPTQTAESKRVHRTDRWGKSSRFYPKNGKNYVSVTTAIRAMAKPALIPWAAGVEREACIETAWDIQKAAQNVPFASREDFGKHFSLRLGSTKAHAKQAALASDIGSEAHKRIEWLIQGELGRPVGPEPPCRDEALWAVMAYEDWRKASNMSPIFSEEVVYSDRYEYAGTLDLAAEIDIETPEGRIRSQAVIDFKSGKGIYLEALLQNAALLHALIEEGRASGSILGAIVRLPKVTTDPEFEVRIIPAEDQKKLFKAFLGCLDLWRFMDSKGEAP